MEIKEIKIKRVKNLSNSQIYFLTKNNIIPTDWMELRERVYVITNDENEIVGTISFDRADALIKRLFIIEKYRRQGYGTMLVQHCINVAKILNYNTIYTWIKTDNETSRNLFEKIGFAETTRFNMDEDNNVVSIKYKYVISGDE